MLTTDDSLQINDRNPHLNAVSKKVDRRIHALPSVSKFISQKNLRVMRAVILTFGMSSHSKRYKLHGRALQFACQKQPTIGVFKKRCTENMQQIYRRTPM